MLHAVFFSLALDEPKKGIRQIHSAKFSTETFQNVDSGLCYGNIKENFVILDINNLYN